MESSAQDFNFRVSVDDAVVPPRGADAGRHEGDNCEPGVTGRCRPLKEGTQSRGWVERRVEVNRGPSGAVPRRHQVQPVVVRQGVTTSPLRMLRTHPVARYKCGVSTGGSVEDKSMLSVKTGTQRLRCPPRLPVTRVPGPTLVSHHSAVVATELPWTSRSGCWRKGAAAPSTLPPRHHANVQAT